jgi:hypothetical protein
MNEFDHEAFRDAAGVAEDDPPVTLPQILEGIGRAANVVERELDDARARADAAETVVVNTHAATARSHVAAAAIERVSEYECESDDEPWHLANAVATRAPEHLESFLDAWADADGDETVAAWEQAQHEAHLAQLAAQADHAHLAAYEAEQERRAAIVNEVERFKAKSGPLGDTALDVLREASTLSGVDVTALPPEALRGMLDTGFAAAKELQRTEYVNQFRHELREAAKLNHLDFDHTTAEWKRSAPVEDVDLSRLAPKPTRAQEVATFRAGFREAVRRGGIA